MQNHRLSRQGFTLVELSVVLVVIGLLIGGILIGQSLIESVKLNKFAVELSQYEAAISNFKTTYRLLPGESRQFPHDTSHPDRLPFPNGKIEPTANGTPNFFGGELKNAWPQLTMFAPIKGITYPPIPDVNFSSLQVGVHTPKVSMGEGCGIVFGRGLDKSYFNSNDLLYQNNIFYIGGLGSNGSCLSDKEVWMIDAKLDNGHPVTGVVASGGGTFTLQYNGNNECHAPHTGPYIDKYYVKTNTAKRCSVSIKLFRNGG